MERWPRRQRRWPAAAAIAAGRGKDGGRQRLLLWLVGGGAVEGRLVGVGGGIRKFIQRVSISHLIYSNIFELFLSYIYY